MADTLLEVKKEFGDVEKHAYCEDKSESPDDIKSESTYDVKSEVQQSLPSFVIEESSSSSDGNVLITKEMEEIERKIFEHDLEQERLLLKEYSAQHKEEPDMGYRRLTHLLGRSQFYSTFIMQKLESSLIENSSKRTSAALRQQKEINTIQPGNQKTPKRGRGRSKKGQESIALADVINIETFREVTKRKQRDADTENLQKVKKVCVGTRVTSLGFEVPETQPLLFEGGVLRPYQLEGLEWMKVLYENGVNGMLADEMGLGKTVQIIAFICYLIEMGVTGPFLLIAPLATLPNWALEFERFAPQVPVILFHGTKEERRALYRRFSDSKTFFGKTVLSVVLTSYQIPKIEKPFLSLFQWRYLIVDEGHALKNIQTQLSRVLRSFKTGNRMLLTGTPLQNTLSELWALLNFLLPDIFDDRAVFETMFDLQAMQSDNEKIIEQEKESHILSTLHQILAPFLLRRLKSDVDLNLPQKKEVIVNCPMTPLQLELYKATLDASIENMLAESELEESIEQPDGTRRKRKCKANVRYLEYDESELDLQNVLKSPRSSKYGLNKELKIVVDKGQEYKMNLKMTCPEMQLRKLSNHPYLIQMPVVRVNGELQCKVDENIINKSGKMLVLDAMLSKLKEKGHKVLLFSYFHIMIDLIQELAIMRNYEYVVLTGATKTLEDRRKMIYRFNTDPNLFLFLMTTRAGGLGLNLTAADTVIIFDSDFNPQVDLQAQDRCHRIGQTKPVVVYRFSSLGTVDEKIISVAQKKRVLEKMVIEKGNFNTVGKKRRVLDLQELKEALNAVNHQKVIHPNGMVFSEEELEELLDRTDMAGENSQTVTENNKNNINTFKMNNKA